LIEKIKVILINTIHLTGVMAETTNFKLLSPQQLWYETGFDNKNPMPCDELTARVAGQLAKIRNRHEPQDCKKRIHLARDYHKFVRKGCCDITQAMLHTGANKIEDIFPDYDYLERLDFEYESATMNQLALKFFSLYMGLHGVSLGAACVAWLGAGIGAGLCGKLAKSLSDSSAYFYMASASGAFVGALGLVVGLPVASYCLDTAVGTFTGSERARKNRIKKAADDYIAGIDDYIADYS